jgi:hypothetical protein
VVAGRRFGKTYLSVREICYHAKEPNREVWYVAPTYRQAKNIAWRQLKETLIDLQWAEKVNESELSITLKNGSRISLKGADRYDSLRGVGLDFIVLDEFADIDPDAWYSTLRPTLSDKGGGALFIGTPKGMNWAYELFLNEQIDSLEWRSFTYTTEQGGRVPQRELDQARKDLDEKTFNQEYRATFETFSGRVYYDFDRQSNCAEYKGELPSILHVGIDMNIDPMSATIGVKTENGLWIIDEIRLFGSNTDELAEEIKERYPKHKIFAYPDPAGKARKTSAGGRTDHTILANAGFVVKAPNRHPAIRDRINAVNSKICSSTGERLLKIDPRCKHTIEGLERHVYQEGTTKPEKGYYDHMMDALGYCVNALYPIRRDVEDLQQPRGWTHRIGN